MDGTVQVLFSMDRLARHSVSLPETGGAMYCSDTQIQEATTSELFKRGYFSFFVFAVEMESTDFEDRNQEQQQTVHRRTLIEKGAELR